MSERRTIDDVLSGQSALARRWFEGPVLAAALLVIPVVFIAEYSTTGWLLTLAAVADWLIWAVFAAEFATVSRYRMTGSPTHVRPGWTY